MERNKLIKEIIPTLNFKFPYETKDYCENLYFENYHCHKDFSNPTIADSGESIENYANRCHELKAKCLFSGEHGNQGNHFHVYTVAEKEKLKYMQKEDEISITPYLWQILTDIITDHVLTWNY